MLPDFDVRRETCVHTPRDRAATRASRIRLGEQALLTATASLSSRQTSWAEGSTAASVCSPCSRSSATPFKVDCHALKDLRLTTQVRVHANKDVVQAKKVVVLTNHGLCQATKVVVLTTQDVESTNHDVYQATKVVFRGEVVFASRRTPSADRESTTSPTRTTFVPTRSLYPPSQYVPLHRCASLPMGTRGRT